MTGRELSQWLFEGQNWRWIAFLIFALTIGPLLIYNQFFSTIDSELQEELGFENRRLERSKQLEGKLAAIPLPLDTEILGYENWGKYRATVFVQVNYQTKTSKEMFLETLNSNLKRQGWTFVRSENESNFVSYKYCRQKDDAILSYQKKLPILPSEYDRWGLTFTTDPRSAWERENLPKECQE